MKLFIILLVIYAVIKNEQSDLLQVAKLTESK